MVRYHNIISLSAFAVALLILAYLVWDVVTPRPISIEDRVDEATILFRADKDAGLFAATCVTVTWQVEQIQAVYLDGAGKSGNGEEIVCFQVKSPTLTVDFQDGTTRQYTLPIRTFANDNSFWFSLITAAALFLLAFSTSPIPMIRRWSNYFWSRLYAHLKAVKVTPEQLRLAQIMGYIFSLLNLLLVITVFRLGNFNSFIVLCLLLAIIGTIAGILPHSHRFLAHAIQLRWVILLPAFSPILTINILADSGLPLLPRSAVRAWTVTLCFWLIAFWLISYALRSFNFDRPRRFAWVSIIGLFVIVALISLSVPLISGVSNPQVESRMENTFIPSTKLLYYYAQFNADSVNYVHGAQNFPSNWRYIWVIHRPTFTIAISQTCVLIDILLYDYPPHTVDVAILHQLS
jgi:hypothetical protein